jgi:hypothetical protein
LAPDASTALRHLTTELFGPLWITSHELQEGPGRGFRDQTFYVFDPTKAGDAIDFWNSRLVGHAIPINVSWFAECAQFVRQRILDVHRPIPGNAHGTMFHSTLIFASSIEEERRVELSNVHLSDLPGMAYFRQRNPLLWRGLERGRHRREVKMRATGAAVLFNEDVKGDTVRVPAPSPSFANYSERYVNARWTNVITPSNYEDGGSPATVYPTNL